MMIKFEHLSSELRNLRLSSSVRHRKLIEASRLLYLRSLVTIYELLTYYDKTYHTRIH